MDRINRINRIFGRHRQRTLRTAVALVLSLFPAVSCFGSVIGVPDDRPTVQEAIDAAVDGDTVMVKPGEYAMASPLSFTGKEIVLKGENGPAETTLRVSEMPADPSRASVVIFESGERERAVLEGFTLTGGRGTPTPSRSYAAGRGHLVPERVLTQDSQLRGVEELSRRGLRPSKKPAPARAPEQERIAASSRERLEVEIYPLELGQRENRAKGSFQVMKQCLCRVTHGFGTFRKGDCPSTSYDVCRSSSSVGSPEPFLPHSALSRRIYRPSVSRSVGEFRRQSVGEWK